MRLDELKARYELRKLPDTEFAAAEAAVRGFDAYAQSLGGDADTASVATLDGYIKTLVAEAKNNRDAIVGLLRYFHVIGRTDLYIRTTQYTGGLGVVETILERLERVSGKTVHDRVAAGLMPPPLGTSPDDLPAFTADLMRRLRAELSGAKLERVLSGNNHGIPDAAFAAEKAAFDAAPSFSSYLAAYHDRQVAELQTFAASGKPWYEQRITQEVVDFVRSQPEIQGGAFKEGWVFETKIPYDVEGWLHAATPEAKRHCACHCPFARESVLLGKTPVDPLWCHCSGGFTKRRYELLFGRELSAKCVANVLQGDFLCRFAVDLRGIPNLR